MTKTVLVHLSLHTEHDKKPHNQMGLGGTAATLLVPASIPNVTTDTADLALQILHLSTGSGTLHDGSKDSSVVKAPDL